MSLNPGDRTEKPNGSRPTGRFSKEERAAMREYAAELKAAARGNQERADGEAAVLAKIAEMSESDRTIAERLHALITSTAPSLSCRTWYGMPAYAKDGRVLCFFQSAEKFHTRYATLGFSDQAKLDAGNLWPTTFALRRLTAVEEAQIRALVEKAVG